MRLQGPPAPPRPGVLGHSFPSSSRSREWRRGAPMPQGHLTSAPRGKCLLSAPLGEQTQRHALRRKLRAKSSVFPRGERGLGECECWSREKERLPWRDVQTEALQLLQMLGYGTGKLLIWNEDTLRSPGCYFILKNPGKSPVCIQLCTRAATSDCGDGQPKCGQSQEPSCAPETTPEPPSASAGGGSQASNHRGKQPARLLRKAQALRQDRG